MRACISTSRFESKWEHVSMLVSQTILEDMSHCSHVRGPSHPKAAEVFCIRPTHSWSCRQLELQTAGVTYSWSCRQLELQTAEVTDSWSCRQLELQTAGVTDSWSCRQLELQTAAVHSSHLKDACKAHSPLKTRYRSASPLLKSLPCLILSPRPCQLSSGTKASTQTDCIPSLVHFKHNAFNFIKV